MAIGVDPRNLSVADQLMVMLPCSGPRPTSTPTMRTDGLVSSTSTQTCGASPGLGAGSLKSTPLRAISVNP